MVFDAPSFYAIAPSVFTDDGRMDASAVAENVVRLSESGVRGVLLTGSYGEFQTLEPEERVAITEAVRRAAPQVTVMSGAAALNRAAAIDVGHRLFDAGAHQVMVSAPFAAELTDADLETYFDDVASQLSHDLVVYNNPVFGVDLAPALLERITRHPAYTAVKQGTKLLAAMVDSITRVQWSGQAQVLAAADLASAGSIGAGASGVTSTNVWVFPEVFLEIADPAVGPARKAELINAVRPYVELVREFGQPRTIKAAMVARGYAGTKEVRAPYRALDDVQSSRLNDALAESDDRLAALESAHKSHLVSVEG